jgi:rubrerythrin
MYPGMKETAKSEKDDAAFQTFNFANEVEKVHAALYSTALEKLGKNEVVDYYVCPVCGNTVEKTPPEKCPICGAPGKGFMKIA